MKSKFKLGIGALAIAGASFFGGHESGGLNIHVEGDPPFDRERWSRGNVEMLLSLGARTQDIVKAIQLEIVTGLQVDVMALRAIQDIPPNALDWLGRSHLQHHIFPNEDQ